MITDNNLKILIVDDEQGAADMMSLLIKNLNVFEVDIAPSSRIALEKFESQKYVMVLLDLNIDGTFDSGIELGKKIREIDSACVIVLVTGYYDAIFDSRTLGVADDFIKKPFDIDYFNGKIFLWLAKYNRDCYLRKYIDGKIVPFDKRLCELKILEEKVNVIITKMETDINA